MPPVLVKQLIEAGVHFGHRASRWNPKMRPYIYARQNLIHIIDVRETIRGLLRAKKYLKQVASGGGLVLFVGTKRQAGETIERESERCGMPCVSDRWLGGTLTNFRTIRGRLTRLEELEQLLHRRGIGHLLQEDAVGPVPRVSQDVPQPHGMRTHESLARVHGGHRPQERAQRDSRGPQTGHHHRGVDRHRQRSGRGRSADSGQRRQHSLDRIDRAAIGRRHPGRQGQAIRARWNGRSRMSRTLSPSASRGILADGGAVLRHKRPAVSGRQCRNESAETRAYPSANGSSGGGQRRRATHWFGQMPLPTAPAQRQNHLHDSITFQTDQEGLGTMSEITAAMVKSLRDKTGLPMMKCKEGTARNQRRRAGSHREAAQGQRQGAAEPLDRRDRVRPHGAL